MNFISIEFLLFFPLILFCYWKSPAKWRPLLLLFVSYFFYWYWNHWTIFLLAATTGISYVAAIQMSRTKDGRQRKMWLISVLVVSLGSLFVFKYLGFFTWNISSLLQMSRRLEEDLVMQIILPVGISFYTFQTMSYVIDVYKKEIEPENNFIYYALFVSFFPQLVAGPIERPAALLPQFYKEHQRSVKDILCGLQFMLRGYFKKVVIADFLSRYVDLIYENPEMANGPLVVLGTMMFAIQIYCDFSGYSDIAVGAARMMGIRLMQNFDEPYRAVSIRDFWHRWHISLTSWFTDYVYKPLGGSRKGVLRQCINVGIVFLLSGLWHGAAWNYVIWGGIHGIYLVIETLWVKKLQGSVETHARMQNKRIRLYGKRILTFFLVCFAWLFFRAESIADAGVMLENLQKGWSVSGVAYLAEQISWNGTVILRILLMLGCLPLLKYIPMWNDEDENDEAVSDTRISVVFVNVIFVFIIALAWFSLLAENTKSSFIYFQF